MITDKIKIHYARLKPDEQIPEHTQDTWELAYVVTGRGMRTIGDTTDAFDDGEVILVPPGMTHQWVFDPGHTDSEGNIVDIALFFAREVLQEVCAALPEFADKARTLDARTSAVKFEGERKKELQMHMERLADTETADTMAVCFLAILSLLGVAADGDSEAGRHPDVPKSVKKVERTGIYCDCNYTKRVTLAQAARHVGMNVSSYCKFFLRNFGCTFTEHINSLRIRESCRRLSDTTDHVAEIAYAVGFTSVPYFNRIFRRQCGCTPSQYRARKVTGNGRGTA